MAYRQQPPIAHTSSWALALLGIAVLMPPAPVLTAPPAQAGAFVNRSDFAAFSERRCKWTAKEERCDWVKKDNKQMSGH